jgi:hypothetical protein
VAGLESLCRASNIGDWCLPGTSSLPRDTYDVDVGVEGRMDSKHWCVEKSIHESESIQGWCRWRVP